MIRRCKQFLTRRTLAALPRPAALRLCKGRPRAARLLPEGLHVEIDDYLGEYRVFLNTTFPIEREMVSGVYDLRTLKVLRRQVRPGAVCIDIGANVGALTLALAQCAGPHGLVLAVEPGTPNFRKLQRNVAANPQVAHRVRLFQVGLGSREGFLHWREEESNRGNALLVAAGGTERVRVTTLDSLLDGCPDVPRVDFLKIDVEGMELDVLRGAERTLRTYRPAVYFESQRAWRERLGAAHFRAIEELLTAHGYELLRTNRDGSLARTRIEETSSNTLAVPRQAA